MASSIFRSRSPSLKDSKEVVTNLKKFFCSSHCLKTVSFSNNDDSIEIKLNQKIDFYT